MTLSERLAWQPPFHLPFDGTLSAEEERMADQHTFDGPASWEVECPAS